MHIDDIISLDEINIDESTKDIEIYIDMENMINIGIYNIKFIETITIYRKKITTKHDYIWIGFIPKLKSLVFHNITNTYIEDFREIVDCNNVIPIYKYN